ncbi:MULTISPECIES: TetR/AcrR family transcriptional regulator [Nocardiopsis]|uniref:AcrR family transcriptional regulator n=1 Tax=Nocardiopsis sinuspersici TaxID=501010 RepID=A0A1V3BWB2_9ACTN|nr:MULTISPECIES: TetR/AcrR family transcriptional regulator [Nocardiopsis]NYH53986.1 AcrR family transcriptional regulator [Nocardiopsis sinuspersici]OOC52877.1 TetR family transcriptional regulator [Nocardiopsis sinuspersici]
MRQNPERRRALLDAAIDVLAEEGARGLTFRAVDTRAGVPGGTASNYFANRAELLLQAGAHVHVRLTPTEEFTARFLDAEPSREQTRLGMRDLLRRVEADRNAYLALLELRLEANRHPGIREELTRTIRDTLEENVSHHLEGGFPGDRGTVVTLYLAMTGLFVEHLTLPEVLGDDGPDSLVDRMVRVIVPEGPSSPELP